MVDEWLESASCQLGFHVILVQLQYFFQRRFKLTGPKKAPLREWSVTISIYLFISLKWCCWLLKFSFSLVLFQEIEKFRSLAREINSLPTVAHFDMVQLDCDDLKRGLATKANRFADQLLQRLAEEHRAENRRWWFILWVTVGQMLSCTEIIDYFLWYINILWRLKYSIQ